MLGGLSVLRLYIRCTFCVITNHLNCPTKPSCVKWLLQPKMFNWNLSGSWIKHDIYKNQAHLWHTFYFCSVSKHCKIYPLKSALRRLTSVVTAWGTSVTHSAVTLAWIFFLIKAFVIDPRSKQPMKKYLLKTQWELSQILDSMWYLNHM